MLNKSKYVLSGFLAIIGGILVTLSGYAEQSIMKEILYYIDKHRSDIISGEPNMLIHIVLSILTLLISLGGLTIILGGISIMKNHRSSGRVLIGLGGGVGIFGFIIVFGYAYLFQGPISIITHSYYWLGLLFSLIGSQLSRK